MQHDPSRSIVAEFTHQAQAFAASAGLRAPGAVDAFLALLPALPGGFGVMSRPCRGS